MIALDVGEYVISELEIAHRLDLGHIDHVGPRRGSGKQVGQKKPAVATVHPNDDFSITATCVLQKRHHLKASVRFLRYRYGVFKIETQRVGRGAKRLAHEFRAVSRHEQLAST
jgi:hypothetical protein